MVQLIGCYRQGLLRTMSVTPLWRSMLLRVPTGMSFRGCGTVVVPGRLPCRKCTWEPTVRTSNHPAARSLEIT